LPVADVERAQRHYRDALGFEIGWQEPGKEIGVIMPDHPHLIIAEFLNRNGSGASADRRAKPNLLAA